MFKRLIDFIETRIELGRIYRNTSKTGIIISAWQAHCQAVISKGDYMYLSFKDFVRDYEAAPELYYLEQYSVSVQYYGSGSLLDPDALRMFTSTILFTLPDLVRYARWYEEMERRVEEKRSERTRMSYREFLAAYSSKKAQ